MVIGSLLSWLSSSPGHVVIGTLLDFQVYRVMELWVMGLWGYGIMNYGVCCSRITGL